MGGEQLRSADKRRPFSGSSPHGRGTAIKPAVREKIGRFIPAWAGNRDQPPGFPRRAAVHPRMGGEQMLTPAVWSVPAGSSPHGRGTETRAYLSALHRRFIPAWAGNRRRRGVGWPSVSVHPRMGGEQIEIIRIKPLGLGSSPHGRGTASARRPGLIPGRFIPAWAGNSGKVATSRPPRPVHPRMGGEQRPSAWW